MSRQPKIILMKASDDIFHSPATTLVVPVNKVGVMGNGLALAFKNRVDGLFDAHQSYCFDGWESRLFLYEDKTRSYLCFATKNHWKRPSKIEYIEEGMVEFVTSYKELGIRSVAFPAIGCGKGGLKWKDVLETIVRQLQAIDDPDLAVYLYPPY
jgi:O-acetyl-ADP-ribose deacetylase (regulator of RNase III)